MFLLCRRYDTQKEINKKFQLTIPPHMEHKISAIREARDINKISLERIYGLLRRNELEQIQTNEIYGRGRMVSNPSALVADLL